MKIAIGMDHAGFDLKLDLVQFLETLGHKVIDCGTDTNESSDYPDYAHKVADLVSTEKVDRGLLICGSGIGMEITANRHENVRAFNCFNPDMATLARQHNAANIICFGARQMPIDEIKKSIKNFLITESENGRHERRVNKIDRRL